MGLSGEKNKFIYFTDISKIKEVEVMLSDKEIGMLVIVAGIVCLWIIVIVVLSLRLRKRKWKVKEAKELDGRGVEITNYIKGARDAGLDDGIIKNNLESVGWSKEEVYKAFGEV
ncbi:MAG TPA: hypothetical protein VJH95_02565 [Candidatus Nanoarchaeia archaeon]|nr:hypothetical protein [Candidatus Nanoarchaeia archaeon]